MVQSQETHRPPLRAVSEAYVSVTGATYAARAGDRLIGVNRAGAVTITLPTAQLRAGRTYTVKDESGAAASNNITVATEGSETIDGSATDVIAEDYGSKTYYSDGSNWFTVPLLAVGSHILDSHAAGTLQHEKGGLEADVSAGDGFVEVKGGNTTVIKSNTGATAAPGATDDSGSGYSVGSFWIDTTNDRVYQAVDVTTGAAVWKDLSAGEQGTDRSVRVKNSVAQSVADNTMTVVTFDQEVFDTDTMHSTSSNTGRLTATTAGKYLITVVLQFDSNATGNRWIQFRKNGSTLIQSFVQQADQSTATYLHLSCLADLSATDYVEVQVQQTSGGALNIHGTGSEDQGNFNMVEVIGA